MTIFLKQSTASQEVLLGRFVDSTDGNTEETGLSIANTDIKLHKAGATTLASKNSGGATHIANGLYYAVLDATDTGTLGSLVIHVHVSGALSVKTECVVLAANVFDSLIGGGDIIDVSVTQWLGTAAATPTVAGVPEVDVTHVGGSAQDIATQTLLTTVSGYLNTEIADILADTNELQTDWANGGRLDLLIDAIKAKTDLVPGTQDGKTFAELVLLMAAVLLGKSSGLDTTTATFRSVDDTVDRVVATVDPDGNRAAVTLDTSSP